MILNPKYVAILSFISNKQSKELIASVLKYVKCKHTREIIKCLVNRRYKTKQKYLDCANDIKKWRNRNF
jgi:hypothetical protein